jgi:hypothetical protein
MEDRKTPQMHKYGESKTTRIMMATERHVTTKQDVYFRPLDFCWTECTMQNENAQRQRILIYVWLALDHGPHFIICCCTGDIRMFFLTVIIFILV